MSIVGDFRRELDARTTPAAAWHKVDLHSHSPTSHDFRGARATALEDFSAKILEQQLSVVGLTDHDRLPDPKFVEALRQKTGALVLAGLELNVFVDAFGVPADKVGKNVCFHLLIGFDPDGPYAPQYWADHLFRTCRHEQRTFGGTAVRGVADGLDKIAECLQESGAYIIPAHLHSGSDAFRSRSVDKIYSDSQFLRWAREHFTALDVRNHSTAQFFDGQHPETSHLEIGCIRSSDAHEASQLGQYPTWVQMEKVSFGELKAALELPGRISRQAPPTPTSYIEGIHVEGQFLKNFWMTLSPHLNVLIGVKGSGKTSLLECLRFGLGTEVPRERQEEVDGHLTAILGPAGRVRLLVKRDDGARLLIERRVSDKRFQIVFDDDRKVEAASTESIRFAATILGWHEIEHAATDRQIRRLHMDAIAGRDDTKRLAGEAQQEALAILRMHEQAAAQYNEFAQLRATVQQQQAMRDGLQQLKDANLISIRDEMAQALADKEELSRLAEHLASLPTAIPERCRAVLNVDQFTFQVDSPLAEFTETAKADLAELKESVAAFGTQATTLVQSKGSTLAETRRKAVDTFDAFATTYQERLAQFPPEVQRLIESHREVLEKTSELPSLEARLALLRTGIETSLKELASACERVSALLDKRTELRTRKVGEFNQVLRDASVHLKVIPGEAQEDEYSTTLNQYGRVREGFDVLRSSYGKALRFHRLLGRAYESLRTDLVTGQHVMFSRAEFGRLITILENDDLAIGFAVGKPGQEYSPIDQLSAGQRCTAVFPILLKLQEGPLIVDQPEDNLDNRHIARNVAAVLAADKRTRQLVMTSHNANLVVLSDPECIATFEASDGQGTVSHAGFLSHRGSSITSHVLDILDGGERALELRTRSTEPAPSGRSEALNEPQARRRVVFSMTCENHLFFARAPARTPIQLTSVDVIANQGVDGNDGATTEATGLSGSGGSVGWPSRHRMSSFRPSRINFDALSCSFVLLSRARAIRE
jgi:predicted ATPase